MIRKRLMRILEVCGLICLTIASIMLMILLATMIPLFDLLRTLRSTQDLISTQIQWLQQYEIIVDAELQGMINELNTWEWKQDKDGNSLPIPSDKNNHYIDATRYGLEIEYVGIKGLDLS